jgi:glutamate-ammonia-ligase adenylyltransferase
MASPRSSRPRRRPSRSRKPPGVSALVSARPPAEAAARKLLGRLGFRDPAAAVAAIGRLHAEPIQRRSLAKIFPALMRACERSADPDRALLGFDQLVATLPNPNMFYHYLRNAPASLELLVRVFAHSQALAHTLARNAHHLHLLIAPDALQQPRPKARLDAELRRLLMTERLPAEQCDVVRRFRRRETLRIGARDLTGRATLEETTLELSNLAEVCLQAVFEIALQKLRSRYRLKAEAADSAARFAIIGMGKLGGQELNYSSDVDVIFVYGEDGNLTPHLTRHEFFSKLAEEIIAVVGSSGAEGNIFRIDLRLRPEGATGPLARSLDSCENYYAAFGETWERMALVKARPVAGDLALGGEFVRMVQPFVYARHAGPGILQQMAALKQRIETEIVREERLTRHVKLGIGGIREIEFITQSFQILRGARLVRLRERNTLRALRLLAETDTLSAEETGKLAEAYRFLRAVEHRLQMEMELQTHTIPDEQRARQRLARSLGFESVEAFQAAQQHLTAAVRAIYEAILADAANAGAVSIEQMFAPERLARELDQAGFADADAAFKLVERLLSGPGFVHVSQRTRELFARLYPELMTQAGRLADPDAALTQFEKFVGAYGSRGLLYEILAGHPKLVEMLMRLGDASRFLSDLLARQPELFDEICRGGSLDQPKNRDRLRGELTALLAARAGKDSPDAMETARAWHRSELLRIGIEDVMELVDLEQLHQEMTWLAEACLVAALQQALAADAGWSRAQKTGRGAQQRPDGFPFAVIGLGKFGGMELGYGADLDVLFIGGTDVADQARACRVAARVMDFMARPTAGGSLFKVDPRLRPDGEKGPLAGSLETHREYYRSRAQLWEKQALIKARFVAGDETLGQKVIGMIQQIVYEREITPDEIAGICAMRRRIETERGDPKRADLEFKTGPGGLVDVEFLVQTLQLRHAHRHPDLRTAHTLAALNRLTRHGFVHDEDSYQLRRNYLLLRKIESALRRVDNSSVSRLPAEEREQHCLARRLGFETAAELRKTYDLARKQNRALYEGYLTALMGKATAR